MILWIPPLAPRKNGPEGHQDGTCGLISLGGCIFSHPTYSQANAQCPGDSNFFCIRR